MDSDTENESIDAEINDELQAQDKQGSKTKGSAANWGKAKFDYYFTDYVDKDYPSNLTRKEERLASIEQEEAQRIQKKLYSNLDSVDFSSIIDLDDNDNLEETAPNKKTEDIIDYLIGQNKSILDLKTTTEEVSTLPKTNKRKVVQFDVDHDDSDQDEINDDDDYDSEDNDADDVEGSNHHIDTEARKRRPINMAIKKNRGLTPYKKKEYRNPRVKHKLKYKKVMTKRRKLVKEAQTEFHRYSGESTGIKTSTVKSIKLC